MLLFENLSISLPAIFATPPKAVPVRQQLASADSLQQVTCRSPCARRDHLQEKQSRQGEELSTQGSKADGKRPILRSCAQRMDAQ